MATQTASRTLPRALRRTRWPQPQISKRRIATAASVEQHEPEAFIPESVPTLPPQADRRQQVRDAKPFSDFLTDKFNRQHDYLRISLTERCNLRCLYCMPEEGIQLSPDRDILTTAEIYYLSALFVNQGVNKIRLTGGEPTVRKDIVPLMQRLGTLRRNGLKEIALTTNAISLHRKLDDMAEAGLTGVNISLDTLDPHQFVLLTRRQGFEAVMKSINKVLEMNKLGAGIKLKINCVAMRGLNDHQILPFVDMTRDEDLEVRFIEYMPFGGNKWSEKKMLPYTKMLDLIRTKYPGIERLNGAKNDTSKTWQVPGFKGRVGFITSMTHNFCGTCNRLRITSDGNLKVCLHGETEVSLRDILRRDNHAHPLDEAAFEAIRQIEIDRRKPDSHRFDDEAGWISKERELLEVIGAAVKRKKAKHAGIGELEKMKNRPMILIGENNLSQAQSTHPPRYHGARLSTPTALWSRIPTHLLHSSIGGALQSRFYSTDRGRDDQPSGRGEPQEEANTASSSSGSTFGFQSLSGLFQEPPRGRYSRPQRPEVTEERPTPTPDDPKVDKPADSQATRSTGFFTPVDSTAGNKSIEDRDASRNAFKEARRVFRPFLAPENANNPEREKAMMRFAPQGGSLKFNRTIDSSSSTPHGTVVKRTARARPNPFASRSYPVASEQNSTGLVSRSGDTEPAWGLSQKTKASADPKSIPGGYATELLNENEATPQAERWSPTKRPHSSNMATPKPSSQVAATPSPDQGSNDLTHVKASGEAHMVDVGQKPSTKRVAIASSSVRFSNDKPFRLISEDGNKKGDVLSVARIAGIMAAKRTSELIPLCHPIAISKVEVDVDLRSAYYDERYYGKTRNGSVSITAQVECAGPTGVEMEALTAASTAALTVFDMCKAVDRTMTIRTTCLVYKSGGKSGTYVDRRWAPCMGEKFFLEQGLALPERGRSKLFVHKPQDDSARERVQ